MTNLLEAALAFAAAGCSVVPARTDGSKAPVGAWKIYQTRRPTDDELTAWFRGTTYDGLGLICGEISGHLEMLELEGRSADLLVALTKLCDDNGLGEVWRALTGGYLERSPSGGFHWLYRVTGGPARPNTKLARRPGPDGTVEVLAETRGEGGYVVVAPSAGRTHPTGAAWTLLAGGPTTIPTLTVDDRDALHLVISLLDQMPAAETFPTPNRTFPARDAGDIRPGDDYNTRTSWDDILIPAGWTKVRRFGDALGWRRPGKTIGISATTGRNDADNLYVFTTSTVFDAEKPYSKFAAHTLLNHGGDYQAAAKALAAAGYGSPPKQTDLRDLIIEAPASVTVDEPHYTRTDDGNALRLVDAYRDGIRYCPQRGTWLVWDGHRWTWDHGGIIREHARAIARQLPATDRPDEAHKRRSLSGQAIGHMVHLASTDQRIVAHLNTLDRRAYELNTPAGVVDLRTGKLHDPDPAAMHTRSTPTAPDFDTEPRHWLAFLADTFAGDPDITTYVQRLLGISLVGTVLEQVLPFPYGEGSNGKTTLLGAVLRIVGLGDDGYAITAPADLLLATTGTGHPTEIARLAGARLVVTSELDEGQRFAEAKVKQLTGRDALAGRFMRQDWFSFTPTHTLWLLANHQPTVRSGGPAFWRRIRLVPFLHTVPAQSRNVHLEDQLVEEEGPAILAWIVRGAADYFAHGLPEPTSVKTATDAYERDQDTVARFVEETCAVGDPNLPHLRVRTADLRAAYETWCRRETETPVSAKALTLALRSRYDVTSDRTPTTRYYAGIRLNDLDEDPSSGSPTRHPDDDRDEWWR